MPSVKKLTTLGIWMDSRQAYLIESDGYEYQVEKLVSEVDESHLAGGTRSKTAYGPMDVSAEPQHNRRKQHQIEMYFDVLSKRANPKKLLLIFGPGQTKNAFEKSLNWEHGNQVRTKLMTTDKMTENQMIAFVKENITIN
ncbi:MAG: hypothetical protein HKN16_08460 [Saprospiraceae bacterium]|nr:hypothetical protein [Saprospiraceae bacterium]